MRHCLTLEWLILMLGLTYHACISKYVLHIAKGEKNAQKYLQVCQNFHATITPLCVSVDGMLGSEAEFFAKNFSDFLAMKWEKPYGVVTGSIRAHLSFAILRATLLCVRSSGTM